MTPFITWTDIAGANGVTYNVPPGILTQTTKYQRVAISTLNAVSCEEPSNELTITVSIPVPTIDGFQTVCVNQSATYTTDPGMSGYQWQVPTGTGNIISGAGTEQVTIFWSAAGTHNLRVQYINQFGCLSAPYAVLYPVQVIQRTIPEPPQPDPATFDGVNPCIAINNAPVYTYQATPGMNNYEWQPSPGGIPTNGGGNTPSITVRWITAGPQYVMVKYTDPALNDCPADQWGILNVNVKPRPVPTFTTLPTPPVCVNSTGNYFATQPGMSAYNWTTNLGGSVTPGTPAHTASGSWPNAGTSQTCVTYTDNYGCEAASPTCVSVIVLPLAQPSISGPANVCAGAQGVQYSTQSGNLQYQWSVTGGNLVSGQNSPTILVNWFNAGTGSISLNYNTANNCPSAGPVTFPVTIVPGPEPDFVIDLEPACQGQLITFTDASTPASGATLVDWDWAFGDGNFAFNSDTVSHSYTTYNTYNVTLNVMQDLNGTLCAATYTKPLTIVQKPLALFTFDDIRCSTDTVHFYDQSSTQDGYIQEWFWDFGDDNSQTVVFPENPHVKHVYALGGNKTVKLRVTTNHGCMDSITTQVYIEPSPIPAFDFDDSPCERMPLQFWDLSQTNGGTDIILWYWDFGDPVSPSNTGYFGPNPTHEYTSSGTKSVLLIVTNAYGCSDSVRLENVVVNPAPLAEFEFVDTSACKGGFTQFTDLSSTIPSGSDLQWLWDFGDPSSGANNHSTEQNPTHQYNQEGNYFVTLTVTNLDNNCEDDTTMMVTINPSPTAMFSFDNVCEGVATQFHDESTFPGSEMKKLEWNFGDPPALGYTGSGSNPEHTFSGAGIYWVILRVTNQDGCTDSVTLPVEIYQNPAAGFTYESRYCEPGEMRFFGNAVAGTIGVTEWQWTFPNGIATGQYPDSVIFSNPCDSADVTLMVADGHGCSHDTTIRVYVKCGFEPVIQATGDLCTGYDIVFNVDSPSLDDGDELRDYYWSFGDGGGPSSHSTDPTPQHAFPGPGTYTVTLSVTNKDNCTDSNITKELIIHPNPTPSFTTSVNATNDLTVSWDPSALGLYPNTIEWDFGDGSGWTAPMPPTPPTYTNSYGSNPGTYQVCMRVSSLWPDGSSTCDSTFCMDVDVNAVTIGIDTIGGIICDSVKVVFKDLSGPEELIDKWVWNFGNNANPKNITISKPPQQKQVSTVFTYTNQVPDHRIVTLTVFPKTGPPKVDTIEFDLRETSRVDIKENLVACLTDPTITFETTPTISYPAITSYVWKYGDAETEIDPPTPVTHEYPKYGIYHPVVIVTNEEGCTYSDTAKVIIGKPFTVIPDLPESACTDQTLSLTYSTANNDTSVKSAQWDFDGGTIITTSKYTPDKPGNLSWLLTVTNDFNCIATATGSLPVFQTPTASFLPIDNYNGKQGHVKILNYTKPWSDYEFSWYKDNKIQTGLNDPEPTFVFNEDGVYEIMMSAKSKASGEPGCVDTTLYLYKLLFQGLYIPNAFSPTSSNLEVRLFKPMGANLKHYQIRVFDIMGNQLWESQKLDEKGAPLEGWDGTFEGVLMPQGNYIWRVDAMFVDDTPWTGNKIGVGKEGKTFGTFTLIR